MKITTQLKEEVIDQLRNGDWKRKATEYIDNPVQLNGLLNRVLAFIKKKAYGPLVKDAIVLYFYVEDIVKGHYKQYSYRKLITIVAVLIYLVSPYDLVPDFLVSIGFLDDAALIGYVISLTEKELHGYLRWRKQQRKIVKASEDKPFAFFNI